LPIFVGGTGLYIDSVARPSGGGAPESDPEYQSKLLEEYQGEGGAELLWQRLNNVDPVSAEKIHRNNVRRVIRALEIFEKTGKTKTYFDEQSRIGCDDVSIGMITLDFHDRENLYKRCDERVDKMISEGLVGEVEGLYSKGLLPTESTAAQAIGYKEIVEYLKREITLCEAVEKVKLSTRRYAKRQLTWFRHSDAVRIYADGEDGKMRSYDELCREVILAAKGLVSEWSKT
jgi:tRNA dimethylallyltransferase